MSYIRFAEDGSNVYIFPSDRGIECCACSLTTQMFVARSITEIEQHIAAHLAAGHHVPTSVIPEIRSDEAWLRSEGIIDGGAA